MGRAGAKIATDLSQPQGSQIEIDESFPLSKTSGRSAERHSTGLLPSMPRSSHNPGGAANLLRRDHFHPKPPAQTSDFEMLLLGASFVTSRCGTDHRQM